MRFPFLWASMVLATSVTASNVSLAQSNSYRKVCDLLSQSEIERATGLVVGPGRSAPWFSGSTANCVWQGAGGTRVILILSNAEPMAMTMGSMLQTGGDIFDGLGDVAVGTRGIPETGGGYNLSFLDAKGGVAVTIPGSAGTSDRTIALGQLIEQHRNPGTAAEVQPKHGLTADVY